MKITAFSAAALLSLALAGVSRADQLAYIEKAVAERAAARLQPGTLFVDWISHMPDSTPRLLRIKSVEVKHTGYEDYYELIAKADELATSQKGNQQGAAYDFALQTRAVEEALDLAYVYVPSSELPGMFVCLGKLLQQPCEVESVALEVPGQVLFQLEPRSGGLTASVDPSSGARDTVWRIGTIEKRGNNLVLKNTRRTLRLSSYAVSEVERALNGRVGARVSLRGHLSADGKSLADVEVIRYHSR